MEIFNSFQPPIQFMTECRKSITNCHLKQQLCEWVGMTDGREREQAYLPLLYIFFIQTFRLYIFSNFNIITPVVETRWPGEHCTLLFLLFLVLYSHKTTTMMMGLMLLVNMLVVCKSWILGNLLVHWLKLVSQRIIQLYLLSQ